MTKTLFSRPPRELGRKPDSPASGDCLVPENVGLFTHTTRQSTATNNLIVQPRTRKANSLITKERLIGGRLPWAASFDSALWVLLP
jgi:hypothetical protein